MGRLFAGMLVAVFAAFAVAGPAGAAEIPPTAKCQTVLNSAFAKYLATGGLSDSESVRKRAARKLNRNLYKADCVSDPKPLDEWLKPDPFSPQCRDASAAARSFFAPIGARLERLDQRYKTRERKLKRKALKLASQIRRLRRAGAPPRKLKRLARKRAMFQAKSALLGLILFFDQIEAMQPRSTAVVLTTLELVSLRCIGGRSFQAVTIDREKVDEPAAKVLGRYRRMVAYSYFLLFFFGPGETASASASGYSRPTLDRLPKNLERTPGPLTDLLTLAATS